MRQIVRAGEDRDIVNAKGDPSRRKVLAAKSAARREKESKRLQDEKKNAPSKAEELAKEVLVQPIASTPTLKP